MLADEGQLKNGTDDGRRWLDRRWAEDGLTEDGLAEDGLAEDGPKMG